MNNKVNLEKIFYSILIWIIPSLVTVGFPEAIRRITDFSGSCNGKFLLIYYYLLSKVILPVVLFVLVGLSICFLIDKTRNATDKISFIGCIVGLIYTFMIIVIRLILMAFGDKIPFGELLFSYILRYDFSYLGLIIGVYGYLLFKIIYYKKGNLKN